MITENSTQKCDYCRTTLNPESQTECCDVATLREEIDRLRGILSMDRSVTGEHLLRVEVVKKNNAWQAYITDPTGDADALAHKVAEIIGDGWNTLNK